MASSEKRVSIIIPSFNDARIVDAIESIRYFDDLKTCRLVIVDGGSRPEIVKAIEGALLPGDVLVSERDKGIFDGLNKGLDLCNTEFIGWLGSDDFFTGQVLASEIVSGLEDHDIFVGNLAFIRGQYVRRITPSWPARWGLEKYGLHNPHYSTFGRAALLKSERFRLDIMGSDIDYFIRIFASRPRVAITPEITVLANEGGFSTQSYPRILKINAELYSVYRLYTNWLLAFLAVAIKLSYKASSLFFFKLFPRNIRSIGKWHAPLRG